MAQVLPAKRAHAFEDGMNGYHRASQNGRGKRPRHSVRDVSEEESSEDESQRSASEQPAEEDIDEEDDEFVQAQTQRIGERLKDKENEVNRPSENGIIEEIHCVNFMCHEQLTVTLGPLINFIIGHNGSGKSAVLTALTICLGGKAAATNRGQNLKSFIKEGKDFCVLSVKVKNQGRGAYKRDLYGDSIYVERHFNRAGTSGFKLRDENRKIVSTKKQHVEDILNAFAFQIDNPMNVLTQDEARQFLNDSNPKKKYTYFLRGTQLETLQKDYNLMKSMLQEMLSKMAVQQEDIDVLRKVAEDATSKALRAANLSKMREQERLLAHQAAWARVEEEERRLADTEEEIRRVEGIIEERRATADEHSAQYEREDNAYSAANQKIQDREAEIEPLKAERDDLQALFQETKKNLVALQSTQREIYGRIKAKTDTVRNYQQQIEEHRQRQAEADNGQYARKVEELDAAKEACEEAKQAYEQHHNQLPDLKKDADTAQGQLRAHQGKVPEKQGQVQRAEQSISALNQGRRNWIDAYPNPRALSQLLSAIDREKARFTRPPVGPMGRHIKVLKPEWSSILEKSAGGSLNAFVVTTKSDQTRLSDLMRKTGVQGYPIYIGQDSVIDTSSQEPNQSLDTWMRVLTIDNNLVRNQMIINHMIDQIVLIPSRTEAERFMHNEGPQQGVKMCFAMADRDNAKGHSIQANPATGSINLGPIQAWTGPKRMQADKEQQIRAERRNLDVYKQELEEVRRTANEAEKRISVCQNRLQEHGREVRQRKLEYQEAQEQVERLDAELSAATPDAGMIEQLEEELQGAQRDKEFAEEQYQDSVVQKDKLDTENRTNKDNLEAAQHRIALLNIELGKARAKSEKASSKRTEALQAKNQALEDLKRTEDNKGEWEESKGTQLEIVEELTSQAQQICARVQVPEGKTYDDLDKARKRHAQERQHAEKDLGGSEDELLRIANEAKRKHKDARQHFIQTSSTTTYLERALDMRQTRWEKFRQHIGLNAQITFGYLLSERAFRGELKLDHRAQALEIQVQPDMTIADGTGRQTKTLSGGEKSFSTICLLLSIWDAMGSPIRCLDEFDVFMDNVNRNIAMKMIIGAARRAVGRQYIFITPQSMQDVHSKNDVKIIRMSDPERGQTALNVQR